MKAVAATDTQGAQHGGAGCSVLLYIGAASFVPGLMDTGETFKTFPRRLHRNPAVVAVWSTPAPCPASLWGAPSRILAVRLPLVARYRENKYCFRNINN